MPRQDYDEGRAAGVHEGRRLASDARRWTDLLLIVVIAGSAALVVRHNVTDDRRLIDHVNHNAYVGCDTRNKVLLRQVKMYRQEADLVGVDAGVSPGFREQWTKIKESASADIERIGVQDCSVYLRKK